MRITSYHCELNEDRHNILVKEQSKNYPCESFDRPGKIVDMLNSIYNLQHQAEEHLYMIAFNTKCSVLGVFEVSHGTVDCSICNPRDIFIKALLCGATNIVLAHNHPSGDTTPSSDDLSVCKSISETGKMLGISLLDNLIVGDKYFSFKEAGYIK